MKKHKKRTKKISKIEKEINILGVEYKVIFYNEPNQYEEVAPKGTSAYIDYQSKTIHSCVVRGDTGKIVVETMQKNLWHEIGHAVEFESPSSIPEKEYTAVYFEYVPMLIQYVDRMLLDVFGEFRDKLPKSGDKDIIEVK